MRTKYTKDLLEPIVSSCFSISQVLEKLGLKKTGGNYRQINKWIRYHNINKSHFTGQLWSKGKTKDSHPSLKKVSKNMTFTDELIFIENSRYNKGPKIIERLVNNKDKKYCCEKCGISEWMNKPITLHLDHKNGINNDNRKENLQILCPNCHQQTKTWGYRGKNGRMKGTGLPQ